MAAVSASSASRAHSWRAVSCRSWRYQAGSENAKSMPTMRLGSRVASAINRSTSSARVRPPSSRTNSPSTASASQSARRWSGPLRPDQSMATTRGLFTGAAYDLNPANRTRPTGGRVIPLVIPPAATQPHRSVLAGRPTRPEQREQHAPAPAGRSAPVLQTAGWGFESPRQLQNCRSEGLSMLSGSDSAEVMLFLRRASPRRRAPPRFATDVGDRRSPGRRRAACLRR